tara:strand:+ start:170 stop:412 length:243 start_codon:yes stop_codon:yes gene_type:complete
MTINDLKVGDLLMFGPRWRAGADGKDIGIVMEVLPYLHSDDPCEVLVHWQDEQPSAQFHDEEMVNDWFGRGLVEVIGDAK